MKTQQEDLVGDEDDKPVKQAVILTNLHRIYRPDLTGQSFVRAVCGLAVFNACLSALRVVGQWPRPSRIDGWTILALVRKTGSSYLSRNGTTECAKALFLLASHNVVWLIMDVCALGGLSSTCTELARQSCLKAAQYDPDALALEAALPHLRVEVLLQSPCNSKVES